MKKFIQKLILFILPFPALWMVLIVLLTPAYNATYNERTKDQSLFIWGDSQLYRGIDFGLLSKLSGRVVNSNAEHGSGPYDFLMFTEAVPDSALVLLSISKTAQLRRISKDRSMSGISFQSLLDLKEIGYSIGDIGRIILKNTRPKPLFLSENSLYPKGERSFTKRDSLLFESVYESSPSFASIKQQAYLLGVDRLLKKKCRLLLIDFPYHTTLLKIEDGSPAKQTTDAFMRILNQKIGIQQIDHYELNTSDKYMRDFTHLDSEGARLVTAMLAQKISQMDQNSSLVIR